MVAMDIIYMQVSDTSVALTKQSLKTALHWEDFFRNKSIPPSSSLVSRERHQL